MENKLKQANQNIEELVNRFVWHLADSNKGNCLRFLLFDERKCDKDCGVCNQKQLERYRKALLNDYLVK